MRNSPLSDVEIHPTDRPALHLNIEVTRRCNQRCFYCFNDSGPAQTEDTFAPEKWKQLFAILQPAGMNSVHITGGEPFMWNGTIALLQNAQCMGIETSILSNGSRVKQMIALHPDVFNNLSVAQISMDSVSPQEHNFRRGTSHAWKQAVSAILELRRHDVVVELSCVIDDQNIHQLANLTAFAEDFGCRVIFRPMVRMGRAQTTVRSDAFFAQLSAEIGSLRMIYPGMITEDRFCYVPTEEESGTNEEYGWGRGRKIYTTSPSGHSQRSPLKIGRRIIPNLRELVDA